MSDLTKKSLIVYIIYAVLMVIMHQFFGYHTMMYMIEINTLFILIGLVIYIAEKEKQ